MFYLIKPWYKHMVDFDKKEIEFEFNGRRVIFSQANINSFETVIQYLQKPKSQNEIRKKCADQEFLDAFFALSDKKLLLSGLDKNLLKERSVFFAPKDLDKTNGEFFYKKEIFILPEGFSRDFLESAKVYFLSIGLVIKIVKNINLNTLNIKSTCFLVSNLNYISKILNTDKKIDFILAKRTALGYFISDIITNTTTSVSDFSRSEKSTQNPDVSEKILGLQNKINIRFLVPIILSIIHLNLIKQINSNKIIITKIEYDGNIKISYSEIVEIKSVEWRSNDGS
jgi:hypothetical protein